MSVPPEVRAAALAAFQTRRREDVLLLPVEKGPSDGPGRAFRAAGLQVHVSAAPAGEGLVELTVRVEPPQDVAVELERPPSEREPAPGLRERGQPPLRLVVSGGRDELGRVVVTTGRGTPDERRHVTPWVRV